MHTIGNFLWLLCGGLVMAVMYWIAGLLCCITIIGIPFGAQLFKLGSLALWPFGREVVDDEGGAGCLSLVFNILWIVCCWWEIALAHIVFGLLCCITIIGIPFGKQHFKMAILSFLPFGKVIK